MIIDSLDYSYFRIRKFYEKRDTIADFRTLAILTVFIFGVALTTLTIITVIFKFRLNETYKLYTIIFMVVTFLLLRQRYSKISYDDLRKKWLNEPSNTKLRKGIIMIATMVTSLFIPIIVGILRYNFGLSF